MLFNSKQWTYLQRGYHLTPRELQVEGLEDDQIATQCGIKYNTARAHLSDICGKVAVKGKVGLILQFLEAQKKAR